MAYRGHVAEHLGPFHREVARRAGIPSTQIVFIRALVGLVLIAPLIWRSRGMFRALPDLRLHLLRVVLSVVTLSASFFAIPRVPFAVFTAVGFTRPLVTMVMAAVVLHEAIGARRWIAAGRRLRGRADRRQSRRGRVGLGPCRTPVWSCSRVRARSSPRAG